MYILGLSFDYHDAAAALISDGAIVAVAQEERFSRVKHDARLPKRAIAFCLEEADINADQLDAVCFYENTTVKLDRILRSSFSGCGIDVSVLNRTVQSWMQGGKLCFRQRIAEATGIAPDKIFTTSHHQAHTASAYFCSPFQEATIITIDGVGELETMTVSIGRGSVIEKVFSVNFPDSVGLLYSAFTAFLGFEVNEGEYKVMGMGAFGRPVHVERIRALVELLPDGGFRVDQSYFNFNAPEVYPFTDKLVKAFGEPRVPDTVFDVDSNDPEVVKNSLHYADIAASVQAVTEELIMHIVSMAIARTGIRQVAMAGGVALNSLANGKIQRELGIELFIQPSAGDSGGALGTALWYAYAVAGLPRHAAMNSAFLGKSWTNEGVEAELRSAGVKSYRRFDDIEELLDIVAGLLQEKAIIGWMHGRSEWGPRSLGARTIIANPLFPETKSIVNEKIKFREPFRPFAPAVLAERAHEYFEIPPNLPPHAPESFMLAVAPVREEHKTTIPAVTHADGSARVQLVHKAISPRFHALIEHFGRKTGVPVVLNTSFNLRGEPIVNSPYDALRTFSWSGIDYLVLENFLITKKDIAWR
ncbi:MAG: hypothetical protein KKF77_14370 [Proteobacteria bacterium]|nr:hypothetical protein [Pseudomonadota bacterium]